jgi:hypothetical protein
VLVRERGVRLGVGEGCVRVCACVR